MDLQAELDRERSTLAKADEDLREGKARVDRQEDLVAHLRAKGRDTREGERLLGLLQDALVQWRQHRVLIADRVAYLEAKLPALEAAGGPDGEAPG